jgi:hypothetical protein
MALTIQEAKRKHEASILRIEGVVSVGIGIRKDRTRAIVIGLKQGSRDLIKKIPTSLEGYPVEIRIIGSVTAML